MREEINVEFFGKNGNSVVAKTSGSIEISQNDLNQVNLFFGIEFPDGEKLVIRTQGTIDKAINAAIDVLDSRLRRAG